MVVRYEIPRRWIRFDGRRIINELTSAKAAVLALTKIPYQRSWADRLQRTQLKSEVAGTSRIEGADFTARELDAAFGDEAGDELFTRSQRQARAATGTYRWIAGLDRDRPIDDILIRQIHARIIRGCDDDHCPPGELRSAGDNVVFGTPRHRGAEGGRECEEAFTRLCAAIRGEFKEQDPLIQALALHYHVGAIHPFLDGNGRTARALQALILQRSGLRDDLFVAMSNYYYDEKAAYLAALHGVTANDGDLTEFLAFGLKGIALQCDRLLSEINIQVSKALFRNVMYELFGLLRSRRKRVLAKRQIEILKLLLEFDDMEINDLLRRTEAVYGSLGNPRKAFVRDLQYLLNLEAIDFRGSDNENRIFVNLEWPTLITETDFFQRVMDFPKARTYRFLQQHLRRRP